MLPYCEALQAELAAQSYDGEPIRVRIDDRDIRGGEKKWQWVKKGVPMRLEIGPRDIAERQRSMLGRRDSAAKADQTAARRVRRRASPRRSPRSSSRCSIAPPSCPRSATVQIDSLNEFEDVLHAQERGATRKSTAAWRIPLRRLAGDGREAQGAEGDRPLHPDRRRGRARQVHLHRPAEHPPRRVCEGVLR